MMKTILDTVDFLDGIIFIYHQALLDIMSTSTENHSHPCKCKLINLYNNNNFLYNQHLAWHRQKVSLLLCLLIARNSELFAEAEAGNSLDIDKMIIADSAYPLKGWLINPFKDNCRLGVNQRRFKRILFSARQSVERCSGHLKERIRWLHKIPFRNPVDTTPLIVSI